MDNTSIREELLNIFKQHKNFDESSYFYFVEKTTNNLFLKSIFKKEDLKLSFLEEKNKKYLKEEYIKDSIIIFNCDNLHLKKKKEELLRTFFFLQRLIINLEITLKDVEGLLEGNLMSVCEEVSLETKKEIFNFYKITEKIYFLKIHSYTFIEEVKAEEEISTFLKKKIVLKYKAPNKWYFKTTLFLKEEVKLLNLLKKYMELNN